MLLGKIASCSTGDYSYCYPFLSSAVCRLLHACTMLKLFDGFTCHLAGTLVGSNDTLGFLDPPGKGEMWGKLNPPA